MSVLALVRHGQASYMSEDYDRLSALGELQARKLADFWLRHEIRFDQVFTGPTRRHRRTEEIVAETFRSANVPWPDAAVTPDLDEFDAFTVMKTMLPVLLERDSRVRELNETFRRNEQSPEAGKRLQELFELVASHWVTGEFDTPHVESWAQFRERIRTALQRIRASTRRSSWNVAFTSAGPIAASVGVALELDAARTLELLWISRNCSFTEFLFTPGRFSLSSFNSFPHLDDRSLLTYR